MRIAHVISTPAGVGGAEQVMAAIVRASTSRGHESLVLNPFGKEGNKELERLCAPATFEAFPATGVRELPRLRRWLQRRIADADADVVHAHLFHAGVAVATLRVRGVKVLTHHHASYFVHLRRPAMLQLDRWAGRRYARVVAVSDATKRFLVGRYGYSPEDVLVIRNGWEGDPVPVEPPATPTAICVANFREEKDHATLLRAFSRLQTQPAPKLLLVGDGKLRGAVEAEVQELGLGTRVDLVGSVEDVWPYLARADVFALASRAEPLGIAVLEAMAAGLPVVTTRAGGLPELVDDGISGILVEPGDPEALTGALDRVFSSPKLRERMGQAGAARAQQMSMGTTTQKYVDLYSSLSGGAHE